MPSHGRNLKSLVSGRPYIKHMVPFDLHSVNQQKIYNVLQYDIKRGHD